MRVLLSWSSGKDSAWTLFRLRSNPDIEVAGLLTTMNREVNRVAMHGVRASLVEAQAAAVGLPLWRVEIPDDCINEEYEHAMRKVLTRARDEKIEAVAFGDLFLDDIRAYREERMRGSGIQPLFPLWGIPTTTLARDMIARGLRARLVCVDPKVIPERFAGREFDDSLLQDLPPGADPCGENGEFHTFAYAGPMFSHPIEVTTGERVSRDGFTFADLNAS